MSTPTAEQFVTAQAILATALVFILGVAAWGVKRFVNVVDALVLEVGKIHDRVASIEVRQGIVPEERAAPRPIKRTWRD